MLARRTWIAVAALAAIAAAVAIWFAVRRSSAVSTSPPAALGTTRAESSAAMPARRGATLAITGSVVESGSGKPVAGVAVVFRSAIGETTTKSDRDGRYRIEVLPGTYRAFVRDPAVLSVGQLDRVRLPNLPDAPTIGLPDEALLQTMLVERDASGVDLVVMRAGTIVGLAYDPSGKPLAGAVVKTRSQRGVLPVLGSDRAQTDGSGAFELRVPPGEYVLEASHARYAGSLPTQVQVHGGGRVERDVTLVEGCVISGKVVGADGRPANDGAIERQFGAGDDEFSAAGPIASDGTFRWTTAHELEVTLRAWPWKSPVSAAKSFACHDGARHEDVVFRLPDVPPDMAGVVVDAAGTPVPFTYLDVAPLDPGGISQQERADASGAWGVFHMAPGRYRITAQVPGRGIVATTIVSPARDVELRLGGVGTIEGSAPQLANGSFDVRIVACRDGTSTIPIAEDRRLVLVTAGRFTLDGVPACEVELAASWHGRATTQRVTVPANGKTRIEIPLGPPHPKHVTGIVRDQAGRPVASAVVKAAFDGEPSHEPTAITDERGRFELDTYSGAALTASARAHVGTGKVGFARIASEHVDLRILDTGDDARR